MKLRFRKRQLIQSVAVLLLLFYAFTTGLHNYIYHSQRVYLATFILAVLIMLYYNGKNTLKHMNVCSCLIIVMAIFVIYNNQNIANNSWSALYYTLAIFVFYIFAQRSDEWHMSVLYIIAFAGLFYAFMTVFLMIFPAIYKSVVYPLFESYSGGEWDLMQQYESGYMPGFTPHYSTNGMYLAVGLGFPIAYIISRKKDKSILIKLLFIFIIFALLLTGKRAHCIFGILAFLICYYFMNCDKPVNRWFKIIAFLVIGVFAITIVAEFVPSVLNIVYRFIETAESGDVSLGRETQRLYALAMFYENPLVGIGWDGFKYSYVLISGHFYNVHCVYVQLLCETGIIGAIFFYAFFGLSLFHIIATVRYFIKNHIDIDSKQRIVMAFSLYIQCFFLMYCFTGNPLYDAEVLFPYMMGCAMGEYYFRKAKNEGMKAFSLKRG